MGICASNTKQQGAGAGNNENKLNKYQSNETEQTNSKQNNENIQNIPIDTQQTNSTLQTKSTPNQTPMKPSTSTPAQPITTAATITAAISTPAAKEGNIISTREDSNSQARADSEDEGDNALANAMLQSVHEHEKKQQN
jgi:hypothetical protein